LSRLSILLGLVLTFAAGSPAASARTHTRHAARHVQRRHHRRRHHHPRPVHTKHPRSGVRAVTVSFSVTDENTSQVPCSSDGRRYTIAGTLVLPAGSPPPGVTVYVHGLGFGAYFWHFGAVRGYDYAGAEAALGHASLVIDRLGYGASSIPAGDASCVGSQASIVHQVVQDLRHGAYTAAGMASPPSFARVGLVGHSAGGQLAEVEAYSFRDVDALGLMEWADDLDYSTAAYAAFAGDAVQCVGGGSEQVRSTSPGYAAFGQTIAQYDALMFNDADPAVLAAANSRRTLDPCGQVESILTAVAVDLARIGSIRVPIAYVYASRDAIYEPGWYQLQQALYTSSPKVTAIGLPGVGHAITLERSARELQLAMSSWLAANRL
jgi:dienelactone hydrolase